MLMYCHIPFIIQAIVWAGLIQIVQVSADSSVFKRIVGGFELPLSLGSHAVSIYLPTNNEKLKCAGSLISESYIVTAAHCVLDENRKAIGASSISIGYNNVKISQQTKITATEIIVHPQFIQGEGYGYDIAIIKVNPVTFSASAGRISIYNGSIQPNQPLLATGWGKTGDGVDSVDRLQGVTILAGDVETCSKKVSSFKSSDGPFICSLGSQTPGRSTCTGDGGGSVMVTINETTYLAGFPIVQVGPAGSSCSDERVVKVLMRVAYFVDFICEKTGLTKEYLFGDSMPLGSQPAPQNSVPSNPEGNVPTPIYVPSDNGPSGSYPTTMPTDLPSDTGYKSTSTTTTTRTTLITIWDD